MKFSKSLLVISILLIGLFLLSFKMSNFNSFNSPSVNDFSSTKNNSEKTPSTQFSAWTAWWDGNKILNSLDKLQKNFTILSPVWYKINSEGKLEEISVSQKDMINQKLFTSSVSLIPTIGNDFDAKRITKLLTDNDIKSQFFAESIKRAKEQNYDGWDLDWEQMDSKDMDIFSQFVSDYRETLNQNGLQLSVTVHAKSQSQSHGGAKAQDWKALGQNADFIRIMAYDFHHQNSQAGPITPTNEYKAVLEYAVSTIPRGKLIIGLPTYGYDWVGKKGEPLQFDEIQSRLTEFQAQVNRDPNSGELRAEYKNGNFTHTIWFLDRESIKFKIDLAREFGVYQFCFWRLGGEDEGIWSIQ